MVNENSRFIGKVVRNSILLIELIYHTLQQMFNVCSLSSISRALDW